MKRVFTLALGLTLAAAADPKLTLDVSKSADEVEIKLTSSEPLKTATQRWKENPHRLEISFPKAKVAAKSHSLDRGVLQKLEVKSAAEAATLEVHALQNPKMRWSASSDQKIWTLKIRATDLAADNAPPALPVAAAAPAKPAPGSKPPVAVHKPTPPKPKEFPSKTPADPTPAVVRVDQRPVTLQLDKKPLPLALRELAQAAGLEAEVAKGVEGTVTAKFDQVPLARALTQMLGQQEKLYEYKIVNNRLQVFGDDSNSGSTLTVQADPTPKNTQVASAPPASALLSDYFPIRTEHSVREAQDAVRNQVAGVQVWSDERLNVLFVRGQASELAKVRELLASLLAK